MRRLFGSLSLLTALILPGSPAALAQQTPAWAWVQNLSSRYNTFPNALTTDAAGNVVVAGEFHDSLAPSGGTWLSATGDRDAFVARYGPGGALQWLQPVTGVLDQTVASVVTDAAGNTYVAGQTLGSMQLGSRSLTIPATTLALFIAKLDAQGQPQWLISPGTGSYRLHDMGLDAAGNIYLTGSFSLPISFGPIALSVPQAVDLFLVKLSPTGTPLWARQGGRVPLPATGGLSTDRSRLTVAPAGECYLSWSCNPGAASFGPTTPPRYGDYDVTIVKYDAAGTFQWQQVAGTGGPDYAGRTALDHQGHLLAALTFDGAPTSGPAVAGPHVLSTVGSTFATVLQLDTNTGNVSQARVVGATGKAGFGSVAVDAAGYSYAVGRFVGTAQVSSQPVSSAGGSEDVLVVGFSPQGQPLTLQSAGNTGREAAVDLVLPAPGRAVVAGYFTNRTQFGPHAVVSTWQTNSDAVFLASLDALPTAVAAPRAAEPLSLYPNPAHDQLHLPALPAGTAVQLIDGLGRVARTIRVAAGSVSVQGLPAGLYQLRATDAQGRPRTGRVLVR